MKRSRSRSGSPRNGNSSKLLVDKEEVEMMKQRFLGGGEDGRRRMMVKPSEKYK